MVRQPLIHFPLPTFLIFIIYLRETRGKRYFSQKTSLLNTPQREEEETFSTYKIRNFLSNQYFENFTRLKKIILNMHANIYVNWIIYTI